MAIGVPYKWLRRAVSQGLGRPDQRNAPHHHDTNFTALKERCSQSLLDALKAK